MSRGKRKFVAAFGRNRAGFNSQKRSVKNYEKKSAGMIFSGIFGKGRKK